MNITHRMTNASDGILVICVVGAGARACPHPWPERGYEGLIGLDVQLHSAIDTGIKYQRAGRAQGPAPTGVNHEYSHQRS